MASAADLYSAEAAALRAPRDELALADLAPGERAAVTGVAGDSALIQRLLDLGFVPGTPVHVVRRAPFGDPTEYELRGYRLCLRRSEGACVRVQRA